MSADELTLVIQETLREIKSDLKDIRGELSDIKQKQEDAAIGISVLETMQKAIDSLKLDERLRKLEISVTQGNTGVSMVAWLITTGISVLSVVGSVVALMKH